MTVRNRAVSVQPDMRLVGGGRMSTGSMLSPADIAQVLGFEAEAIRRVIRRGELRAVKVCGRLRSEPEWVTEWLQARTVTEPAAPSPAPSAIPPRRGEPGPRGSFRDRARRERNE